MIRDHGQSHKYYHDIEGYNGRLDTIQAGILSVKLKHLAGWNENRREPGQRIRTLSEGVVNDPSAEPAWSKGRVSPLCGAGDRTASAAGRSGRSQSRHRIHYPIPLHQQKAYQHLGYKKGDFPVTERVAPEILSLPMFPQLTREQQRYVVEKVLQLTGAQKSEPVPVG